MVHYMSNREGDVTASWNYVLCDKTTRLYLNQHFEQKQQTEQSTDLASFVKHSVEARGKDPTPLIHVALK